MAEILWGEWKHSGGNGMRVGIEWSWTPAPVLTSTTRVYFDYWIWTENQNTYSSDTQTITNYGEAVGSVSYTNSSPGGVQVRRHGSREAHDYASGSYGTSPGPWVIRTVIGGTNNGVAPEVTLNTPIPPRPYALPADPTSFTATRVSDQQAQLSWVRNVTTMAPYTSIYVEYRQWLGSAYGPWTPAATLAGTATSFTHSGLSSNSVYDYRIRASNSSGTSAWVSPASQVWMTPAEPSEVTSALDASGTAAVTTWTANNWTGTTPAPTFTIERSTAGGAWTQVASGLTSTTWTDASPGIGTNQYRVAATVAPSSGTRTSAFVAGNVVSVAVPPLAPTQLSPTGIAVDLSLPVTVTWKHNPGADSAAQSKFWIETSANNGSTWVPLATAIASSASSYIIPTNTKINGTTYQWRVWTQGAATVGPGPKSAVATLIGRKTPVMTLTAPANPLVTIPLTVTWTFAQAQGDTQSAWEAVLYAADGTTVLDALNGTNPATRSAAFSYPVEDGATYIVRARARSSSNQWSVIGSRTTTVDLPLPGALNVIATYDECSGATALNLTAGAVGAGETPIVSVSVERRIAGETNWTTLASGRTLPLDFVDVLPSTTKINQYRIVALSAVPSYRTYPIVEVQGTDGQKGSGLWVFLSYGDAFTRVLRFRSNPQISEATGRVRTSWVFLGRSKPTLGIGAGTTRKVSVSGSLHWAASTGCPHACRDTPGVEWGQAGTDAGVVCYRDYTGRRLFGMVSSMQVTEGIWPISGEVAFDVEETEFAEVYGP
ncbi:MAG TPA: fibronectin type III domain-containing protein [Actinomycetota bacterium]|nr:fibronectin type III domain-containing protein [Actinomycetota bacterium]